MKNRMRSEVAAMGAAHSGIRSHPLAEMFAYWTIFASFPLPLVRKSFEH